MESVVSEHVIEIERRANGLLEIIVASQLDRNLRELLRLIKHPGWTTPAEFLLVTGGLAHLTEVTQVAERMGADLLAGALEVGLDQ